MSTMTLPSATLRQIKVKFDGEKEKTYAELECECDLTQTLADELEITAILAVENLKSASLDVDDFPLKRVRMHMNGDNDKHDLECAADRIAGWKAIRSKDGEVLRYKVRILGGSVPQANKFWGRVGQARCDMTVTRGEEQESLPMEPATKPAKRSAKKSAETVQ